MTGLRQDRRLTSPHERHWSCVGPGKQNEETANSPKEVEGKKLHMVSLSAEKNPGLLGFASLPRLPFVDVSCADSFYRHFLGRLHSQICIFNLFFFKKPHFAKLKGVCVCGEHRSIIWRQHYLHRHSVSKLPANSNRLYIKSYNLLKHAVAKASHCLSGASLT